MFSHYLSPCRAPSLLLPQAPTPTPTPTPTLSINATHMPSRTTNSSQTASDPNIIPSPTPSKSPSSFLRATSTPSPSAIRSPNVAPSSTRRSAVTPTLAPQPPPDVTTEATGSTLIALAGTNYLLNGVALAPIPPSQSGAPFPSATASSSQTVSSATAAMPSTTASIDQPASSSQTASNTPNPTPGAAYDSMEGGQAFTPDNVELMAGLGDPTTTTAISSTRALRALLESSTTTGTGETMAPATGLEALCASAVASFAVFAGSTVTNTGGTVLHGDLGLSPGTAITGFLPGIVLGGMHVANATALHARSDLAAVYDAVAAYSTTFSLADAEDVGGRTLLPGVYTSASSLFITGAVTLDGGGFVTAQFIFQIGSTLITASHSSVILVNGTQPGNVSSTLMHTLNGTGTGSIMGLSSSRWLSPPFSLLQVVWQVGSSATLGTYSHMAGSVLALTSITATTGASVTGRLLAQNGAVTLDSNDVQVPSTSSCTASVPYLVAANLHWPGTVISLHSNNTLALVPGYDPARGREMWKLTGSLAVPGSTVSGAAFIDVRPGIDGSNPFFAHAVRDGLALFVATSGDVSGVAVTRLWATDGVTSCDLGLAVSPLSNFVVFDGQLLIVGADALMSVPMAALVSAAALCGGGAGLVASSNFTGTTVRAPAELTTCGSMLFFTAAAGDTADVPAVRLLYRWLAGTPAPTTVDLGTQAIAPISLTRRRTSFLTCTAPSDSLALVTSAGTILVVDRVTAAVRGLGGSPGDGVNTAYESASLVVSVGRGICFVALTEAGHRQLLCAGLQEGLRPEMSAAVLLPPGAGMLRLADSPGFITAYRGKVYMPCFFTGGSQLCIYDSISKAALTPGGGLQVPYGAFSPVGGVVYFAAALPKEQSAGAAVALWAIAA